VAVVVAGLGFGALGLQGLITRAAALERARAETADLVRLQVVRTKLVVADAAAGTDVLLGPQQLRFTPHDYDYALQPAVIGVAITARQADDAYPLAVANLRLAQYSGQVGSARTLARLGRSEAAVSLSAASETLRSEVLPRLAAVQGASEARLADDQDSAVRGPWLAVVGAVLALLTFSGVHWWLTVRTRRLVNIGLATALVLLIGATAAGLTVVAGSESRAAEVRSGLQPVARRLVEARVAAFDARAGEALSVVSGQVPAAEADWQTSMTAARGSLARAADTASPAVRQDITAATRLLDTYTAVHARLLVQAGSGRRAQAVATATSPTVDGSTGAFEDFDAASGALLARQVQAVDDQWSAAEAHLTLVGWLCLVAGAGAAAVGWRGMAARLREYRG
jgi:hypothetical protein